VINLNEYKINRKHQVIGNYEADALSNHQAKQQKQC